MDMIALHASGMIDHSYFAMVNKVLPLPIPAMLAAGEPNAARVDWRTRPPGNRPTACAAAPAARRVRRDAAGLVAAEQPARRAPTDWPVRSGRLRYPRGETGR